MKYPVFDFIIAVTGCAIGSDLKSRLKTISIAVLVIIRHRQWRRITLERISF